jgi:hypothetical protein
MYSPTLGRWMQQDPMGYVDGMSLYQAYGSVPIAGRDPSGLQTTPATSAPTSEDFLRLQGRLSSARRTVDRYHDQLHTVERLLQQLAASCGCDDRKFQEAYELFEIHYGRVLDDLSKIPDQASLRSQLRIAVSVLGTVGGAAASGVQHAPHIAEGLSRRSARDFLRSLPDRPAGKIMSIGGRMFAVVGTIGDIVEGGIMISADNPEEGAFRLGAGAVAAAGFIYAPAAPLAGAATAVHWAGQRYYRLQAERTLQAECQRTHQQFILQYGELRILRPQYVEAATLISEHPNIGEPERRSPYTPAPPDY